MAIPANAQHVTAPPELVPVIEAALRAHGMYTIRTPQGTREGEHTGLAATWPEPDACGQCGWHLRGWGYVAGIGSHDCTDPTDAQRLNRMLARRNARKASCR